VAYTRFSSAVTDARQRIGGATARPQPLVLAGERLHVVGAARLYVCGITPYDVTHLGHASTFVWADLLASVLGAGSVQARTCRNVTDVDDVLTAAARERGWYFDELALAQESVFEHSMGALRVATPADEPRARHHVHAVVQLTEGLLQAGAAYERDGTVWFRGADVPAAAGLARDEAQALSEQYGDDPGDTAKDDPFDVALWRPSEDGAPAWASPWGWGRPGWHAECAAMAMTVHGACVDVLVGGEDLTFPHHAYQAAMVERVSGVTPFARATMHVGEVRIGGAKMAKSTGNLVLVDDLLGEHSPAALRLLLLCRPYAQAWDFETDMIDQAEARLARLYAAAGTAGDGDPDMVLAALRADLDVTQALDLAETHGGDVARRAIALLKLG
jgi:cysteinyl-tRNA synthetase